MSVAFVVILAFGNLRGIREAGRVFAIPTYFFIFNMALLIVFGLVREAAGSLPHQPAQPATLPLGHASGGLILGVSAFFLLRAFANGSSAMTGTEAISNGVSIFRKPQARNARTTLVLMSTILGVMFLGVSVLAALTHSVPFVSGTPTVVSEIGTLVYGSSPAGHVLYYALQAATALILILAANTSFTGFPFLVSFVAEDSFLPRKLTVRGHRLVFSNGILLLAGASIALLLATGAKVAALIPMYGIGVFTGFTMAGAGMVTHHWRHRDQHWRQRVVVNGIAAVVCAVVVVVFAVSEFTKGAWVVVVVMPLLVYALITTNREYRAEDAVLEEGAAVEACEAKVLRRHVVMVLVDRIDLATARAIQYARALTPDDLHAVHFNIDHDRTDLLIERWQRLGLSRLPLDVIDCPDRRIGRAALELAAEQADGETEVSMVLPRRSYGKTWRRILHDQTADRIVEIVSQLPARERHDHPVPRLGGPAGAGARARAHRWSPTRTGEAATETTAKKKQRPWSACLRRCPAPNRSPRCSGAPGPAWPDGSRRSACSRCRRSRRSSAWSWTTAARPSRSSSWAGAPSAACAAGPGWSPRAWSASTRASWP